MKAQNKVVTLVALILCLLYVCPFILMVGGFFYTEGLHKRGNLTAKQQQEIAYGLGFDMLPGETLTIDYYYADFWPKTIHTLVCSISGIPSEEEFLARCHEDTTFSWYDGCAGFYFDGYDLNSYRDEADNYAAMKKVQGIVNNLWMPWIVHFLGWGGLVAEPVLIVVLVVSLIKRRKAKKAKAQEQNA